MASIWFPYRASAFQLKISEKSEELALTRIGINTNGHHRVVLRARFVNLDNNRDSPIIECMVPKRKLWLSV